MTQKKAWVGNDHGRDLRVYCEDTRRVYSCPEGAALDLSLVARDIKANCDRWIRSTPQGVIFHWLAQYRSDFPEATLVIPEIEFVDMPKPKLPSGFNSKGKLSDPSRSTVRLFFEAMNGYLLENSLSNVTLSCYQLRDVMVSQIQRRVPGYSTTSSGISRHFLKKKRIYEKLFNLQIREIHSKKARKGVKSYYFEYVPGSQSIMDEGFYDPIVDGYGYVNGKDATPVINTTTGELFSSLRKATKLTGIRPSHILYNCRGDITHVSFMGDPMVFKFVRYIDE